ncbi:MAG: rod shape-determining protein MreD, partial [Endomicrobia bacterium]|nr:rod shape-determining protein MreD [Endomicrobiia bacterium]
ALTRGQMSAQCMGFILGLTWDAFSTDVFGVRAVMFAVIGYFAGMFIRSFDKDQVFTQVIMVFVSSIVYWLGFSLIYFIVPEGSGNYTPFAVSTYGSLKIALTVLLAPAVFLVLNSVTKFGRKHI